jgi:2-polyprenyl-6-methoxyphenol hydroxylase-like FAD-dependent oxidoreductase
VTAVPQTGRHAIVVGASLAGLPTAAALADRFDRVTVIERDALPPDGRPRTGVPQGRHGHVLLPSGLRELTALLPGFTDDLRAHGAHLLHVGEIRFHVAGDHLRLDDTELQLVGATRPLLESVVRSRVSALPSVEITDGVDARGLVLDGGVRVTGLSVRRRDGGSATTLDADLVVDAGGRGSPRRGGWPTPASRRRTRSGSRWACTTPRGCSDVARTTSTAAATPWSACRPTDVAAGSPSRSRATAAS